MLPRYRNHAIANNRAEKLVKGEVPITNFFHRYNDEDVEDPENFYASADLTGLKQKMKNALSEFHFPESTFHRKDGAKVDASLAIILFEHFQQLNMQLKMSEASDTRIWSFINIGLIADIIEWRHGGSGKVNIERYTGIRRNYAGYLWISAWLFKDDDADDVWHILKRMSVDSIVQIVERPGIGYNNVFARTIGRRVVELGEENNVNEMSLMRGAMLRARFTNAVIKQTYDVTMNKNLAEHLTNWSKKFYLTVNA